MNAHGDKIDAEEDEEGGFAFQCDRYGGLSWDTQSDMLWCLIGSIVAFLMLTKLHDRYLERFGVV